MDCIFPSQQATQTDTAAFGDSTTPAEAPPKTCRKCGIPQPLDRFPFRKAEQCYRNTCKACRAAESYALRHHPDHAARIREAERVRSRRRRPAIRAWELQHADQLRPGRQRRWARRKEKLAAARLAAQQASPNDFPTSDAQSS